ncbi:MAG: hypothetical protein ABL858_03920, partial [Candidatus Nitrotoga sp.]
SLNQQLREAGITLHLTEIKGPVMDKLQQTHFLRALSGKIFLTHYQAIHELAPEINHQHFPASNRQSRSDGQ